MRISSKFLLYYYKTEVLQCLDRTVQQRQHLALRRKVRSN